MILARIFAGLGNQLFQYAAAHELGLRLGLPVRFDGHTWFAGRDRRSSTRRDYLLPQLGLTLPEASPEERRAPWTRSWWGARRLGPGWTHLYQEGADVPLDAFRRAEGSVLLEGYWQGEAFFSHFKPTLARELLARPPSKNDDRWVERLQASDTVAVHVRRGDYTTNGQRPPAYRVLSNDYYAAALARLRTRADVRRAVVFTDDPAWCSAQLALGVPTQVVEREEPAEHAVDDLLCLAQAKNFLTANSTFSWWAAWIATQRSPANVVAPARWFDDPAFAGWAGQLLVPGWDASPD